VYPRWKTGDNLTAILEQGDMHARLTANRTLEQFLSPSRQKVFGFNEFPVSFDSVKINDVQASGWDQFIHDGDKVVLPATDDTPDEQDTENNQGNTSASDVGIGPNDIIGVITCQNNSIPDSASNTSIELLSSKVLDLEKVVHDIQSRISSMEAFLDGLKASASSVLSVIGSISKGMTEFQDSVYNTGFMGHQSVNSTADISATND
jgi:hypothetical protein